jgi:hypothetical protein
MRLYMLMMFLGRERISKLNFVIAERTINVLVE